MRVSSTMAYETGVSTMQRQQAELLKTQQQLSTGLRVTTAADDPAAAARAVEVSSGASRNTQYMANQTVAINRLTLLESTLGQFGDAHSDLRALLLQAGNATNSDQDRANIAADLKAQGEYLLSLANARDADGAYVFAGYQEGAPAFKQTPTGVVFQGDEGQRELQVSEGRSLPVSVSGAGVFDRVPTGNGVFATTGLAANAGSGVIDAGQVVDASLIDGHAYQLTFHVAAGVTTYDLTDTTAGSVVSTANAYVPGGAINVAGMQVQMTGSPAEGDRFTLAPSTRQSVFNTIANVVALLQSPAGSPAAKAQLQMGLSQAVAGVDRSLDSTLLARAGAGAGLRELDSLKGMASDNDLAYQKELSGLRDVDYTEAISNLTRQQTMSDATQKAFVKIMGRSLFDLL
jgi:flagellar hook-associated protein 3 FlgL